MKIPNEPLEVSKDALGDVKEVGAPFVLKIVKTNPKRNSEDLKNIYSSMYGQNPSDDNPDIEKTYSLHGVATYDPTTDQLKGSGLVEKCGLSMLTITYEYMEVGYFEEKDSFHDFISKIKRNTILEFNGKRYFVKEVAISGVYEGFGIVCNLGCDLYG